MIDLLPQSPPPVLASVAPLWIALWAAAAFLAGSIPFALIIGKSRGIDIREHGSGNVGATNLGRVLGGRFFALCFTLDLAKGLAPTLAFGLVHDLPNAKGWTALATWLAVMVCPVLGHMFSPWIGFKGGKGVATGLGALLGVFPLLTVAGLAAAAVWGASLAISRYVGLSSVLAACSLPITVTVLTLARLAGGTISDGWPALAATTALAMLVTVKHRGNIKRTLARTEPKVGQPR